MPDYQFNTNLTAQQPQANSLADMINLARGAQAFQQAQQINPLELRAKQLQVQQAEQLNPLAVEKATEEVKQAKTGTAEKEFNLAQKKAQGSRSVIGALSTSKAFLSNNRQEMINELADAQQELIRSGFSPAEALTAITPFSDLAHKGKGPQVVQMLENVNRQSVSPETRLGLQTPKLGTNVAGQTIAVNPVTGQMDIMGTPETNPMGVRTQTFTDPVTGNIVQAPVTPRGTLGAPQNLMGGSPAPGMTPQPAAGPQAVPTGSTAETERGRATQAITNYVSSVNALTDASKPGHIPTQEFIAKKLLTYLKDPSVNTGPIADVLAGKSNQATLTSKEQEVLKLIQQRIQNLNPRTDADAQSKKDAYGSFRLKKDALADLVRQDLGNIQNQKLLATGTMNVAGDPRNPNLPAVNKFQAEYSQFSKNPVLMQYMGIVGTGQKAAIDEHDKEALRKLMRENGLSSLGELEQERKKLVELSGAR